MEAQGTILQGITILQNRVVELFAQGKDEEAEALKRKVQEIMDKRNRLQNDVVNLIMTKHHPV